MEFQAFQDYLLLEKNYSKLTVRAYITDLKAFQEFNTHTFSQEGINAVNYAQIRSWIVALVESGVTNRTVNRKISSLNTYYKFLIKTQTIQYNPLTKHKALKQSKKVQVPFSEAEVSDVIALLNFDNSFKGLRDKLIVELFYSTGIRRIELIEVKLSNIDRQQSTLKVLGKRDKERIIPLLSSVMQTIEAYLEKRAALPEVKDEDHLFLTQKGIKVYETLVYRIINRYFSQASTKVKKSPHILRHSFATHLLNQGANLNAVKELLGHASLAATQVYTHNSIDTLKKVHLKAHPRSKQ